MPKQKTHKGLAKRVKVTARGRVKLKKAGAGHLMSGKNAKRRRRINSAATVHTAFESKVRKAILPGS
jgi:large subunit ribosomal protein L35